MRFKLYSAIMASAILSACGSATNEEPDAPKPDEPTVDPTEVVADWSVTYQESSWQNPAWATLVNNSLECTDWKKIHSENLVIHDSQDPNHERWLWIVNYKSTKESEVVQYIDRFIRWTMMPASDYDGLSGIDVFTASLTGGNRDYRISFSYDPNQATMPTDKWQISFRECRFVFNGESLPTPDGYEEWVNDHKQYSSYSSEDANNIIHEWVMETSSLTNEIVEESILKFIHFSHFAEIGSTNRSYSQYYATVTQIGSGISSTYACD